MLSPQTTTTQKGTHQYVGWMCLSDESRLMDSTKWMPVVVWLPRQHSVKLRPKDHVDLLQITFPLSQQIVC